MRRELPLGWTLKSPRSAGLRSACCSLNCLGKQLWIWGCVYLAMAVHAVLTLDFKYHNHSALTEYLHQVSSTNPNMTRLYSIGTSLRGKKLWVMELTTAPPSRLGVPSVKLIGNIHGNEPAGREILLHLIEHLVTNYRSDETVRWLLDNVRIHILPSLNPDGFESSQEGKCDLGPGRGNARKVDLNRSFPDYFQKNTVPSQPETAAVRNWLSYNTFVLSASLHGGALVANYPYENVKETTAADLLDSLPESVSPDDDVFRHLASMYASTHPTMHRGEPCNEHDPSFENGITNGAAWYPLTGGMQDYNYVYHGCMEITLEISCCKYPAASQLQSLWNENRDALLALTRESRRGVKGVIVDNSTGQPVQNARLSIVGREIPFRTSPQGEYWRILLPGSYQLQVYAPHYVPQTINFTIPKNKKIYNPITIWLNVSLAAIVSQPTEATAVVSEHSSTFTEDADSTPHSSPDASTVGRTDVYTPSVPNLTSMEEVKANIELQVEVNYNAEENSYYGSGGSLTWTGMKTVYALGAGVIALQVGL